MSSKGERLIYLDILRVIACFLVVMVHISAQHLLDANISGTSYVIQSIFNTLSFSGVSLYIMISGALMLKPGRTFTVDSMLRKAGVTFLIYFIWKFLYMIYDAVMLSKTINGTFLKNCFIDLISKRGYYHLWFLPVIAIIYLFIPLIKKSVENDKKVCLYYVVIFFILAVFLATAFNFNFKFKYTIQDFFTNNDFSLFTGYLGFYILGHYLANLSSDMKKKTRIIIYILGIVSLPLSGILDNCLTSPGYPSTAMNTPFSLPSFFMTVAIFVFIKNVRWSGKGKNVMAILSKLTLGIYLIHPILIELIAKAGLDTKSFAFILSIPVITVIVAIASGLIVYIVSKIPVVKLLITLTLLVTFIVPISSRAEELPPDNAISANNIEEETHDSSQYELYVNRELGVVTVYENQSDGRRDAIKAFACSCGKAGGHNTPKGTFYTSEYYRWRRMIDGTYAQYAVRINDLIMFHSVPYKKESPDSLKWDSYNKLGTKASLGCIRLAVSDVKWIYDNCEAGTKVVVYEDGNEVLPIKKPKPFVITYDMPYRNWDPTDPDDNNPWKNEPVYNRKKR